MSDLYVPSFELFMARINIIFNPTTSKLIESAWTISEYGHAKQIRDNHQPYFNHPVRASWIYLYELGGRDPRVTQDLLLHDIKEDQHILSWFLVTKIFGEDIAFDVLAMTKLKSIKELVEKYGERMIEQGPWTETAKLCDRTDNLRDLKGPSVEKRERHIRETTDYYLPIFLPELKKHGGVWKEHADKLEDLIHEAIKPYV